MKNYLVWEVLIHLVSEMKDAESRQKRVLVVVVVVVYLVGFCFPFIDPKGNLRN